MYGSHIFDGKYKLKRCEFIHQKNNYIQGFKQSSTFKFMKFSIPVIKSKKTFTKFYKF